MFACGLLAREGHDSLVFVASRPCLDALATAMQRLLPFFRVEMSRRERVFAWRGEPGKGRFLASFFDAPDGLGVAFDLDSNGTVGAMGWRDWLQAWWRRGVVFLRREDQLGEYIPSDLNWDRFAVSFSKGCYTGQEIIARVRYRGAPKRVLCCGELATQPETTTVHNSRGEVKGELIDTLETPNGRLIAARLEKAALDAGESLSIDGQPVAWLQPAYPVDDNPLAGEESHASGG